MISDTLCQACEELDGYLNSEVFREVYADDRLIIQKVHLVMQSLQYLFDSHPDDEGKGRLIAELQSLDTGALEAALELHIRSARSRIPKTFDDVFERFLYKR